MKRISTQPRPDLKEKAEAAGFTFHEMHGLPYWDETSAYAFTLEQVERDIEDPSTELHDMCRQAVDQITGSEELLSRMGIPAQHMDLVVNSWRQDEPELYGRFDLVYSGDGPAKLLEYNADTPTSLFEASGFQWSWLEDMIASGQLPEETDQFNSIHEALVERFAEIFAPGENVHFTSIGGNEEDYGTVETMAWAAKDGGIIPQYTPLEKIGLTEEGQFADDESRVIGSLFKLYPWEDIFRESFGENIVSSGCRFIEPAWKAVVSNKGLLPVLWHMFEGHPNLLPAFFEGEKSGDPVWERSRALLESQGWVEKPLFSREGASIRIHQGGRVETSTHGGYDEHPKIMQLYHALPDFDGNHPVVGSWIIGRACRGIGLREDSNRITQDLSRFKPHMIWPEGH